MEEDSKLTDKAKRLAFDLQSAASDSERARIYNLHLEDLSFKEINDEVKDQVIAEFMDEIESGGAFLHRDQIKDAVKDEVLEEIADDLPTWVPIAQDSARIHADQTINALTGLVKILNDSNSLGGDHSILSDIKKAQLIAVLQAAIEELKGPIVDRGRMNQISKWFMRILLRQGDKQASTALDDGVELAKGKLTEFLENISNNGPPSL